MHDHPDLRLSVVIPAFNEAARLPRTLRDVDAYLAGVDYDAEILVVDDGSSDQTGSAVEREARISGRIRLLLHPDRANRGKGAAVRLGMMAARGRFRLFMDADNSTTIDQIGRFWPWFEQGFDIVIGSRNIRGSQIAVRQAWYKEMAGRSGNLLIRALVVPGVSDTQAGFKMFSSRSAEAVFPRLTVDRWGFDFEALAVARLHGFRIREVPIRWSNSPASKVRLGSYLEVLSEVWRVRRNMGRGLYR
jgi:dolichyl-phosphate beta-glucosyltransferase